MCQGLLQVLIAGDISMILWGNLRDREICTRTRRMCTEPAGRDECKDKNYQESRRLGKR